MNWNDILNQASKITATGLLALILVTGYLGYWVFGSTYQDALKQRDEWKEVALKATKLADGHVVGAASPPSLSPDQLSTYLDTLQDAR
jgi:hypothetical protein